MPNTTSPSPFIVLDIYQFDLSMPYKEGHPLTSIEASVLNTHRAELIQKIAYRWLLQAKENYPEPILPFGEIDILQSRISYLDANYQLAPKKPTKQSFLDRELTAVALQFLHQKGILAPSSDELRVAKHLPEVRNLTRRIIANRFDDILNIGDDE